MPTSPEAARWVTLETTAAILGLKPRDLENRIMFGVLGSLYDTKRRLVAPRLFEILTGRVARG